MRSLQKLARAAWKTPQMVWAEMLDRRMFNEILFSSYEGISRDRLMILADDAFEQVIIGQGTVRRTVQESLDAGLALMKKFSLEVK